jgi:pimeloyl-ACP methyl ester carboxylesterase
MQVERILLPSGRWGQSHVLRECTAVNAVQYHVVLCPGNPGIGTFYLPFAERLHALLGGQVSVRAVNLAGFVAEEHRTIVTHQAACAPGARHAHSHVVERPVVYTLKEQCAFLHEYLRALHLQLLCADELARGVAQPPNDFRLDLRSILSPHIRPASSTLPRRQHRFILVCHSIGAYIGLEAMSLAERARSCSMEDTNAVDLLLPYLTGKPDTVLPPVTIAHSFLLFPFIRMDLGFLHYWSFRTMFLFRPLLKLMVRAWSFLPLSILRLLLRLAMRITSEHAVRAVYDTYTNVHVADAAVFLGQSEFQDVLRSGPPSEKTSFDNNFLAKHAKDVTLYYAGAEHDIWGPLKQMQDLKDAIPGLDARMEPTATHAWCAYLDQSATMARHVAKDIEQLRMKWMIEGGCTVAPTNAIAADSAPAIVSQPPQSQVLSRL